MRTSGSLPHIDVMQDLFAKFLLLCFVGGILGGLYDATGLRESDERKQRARDNRNALHPRPLPLNRSSRKS
ncbi:MAG: hypothetical protein CL859_11325 [Cyanobium sp. ARS6]|nr:hypothetical protein [Cyanobium sp. ARS6]